MSPKQKTKDPIQWIFMYASLVCVAVVVAISYFLNTPAAYAMADLVMFLLAAYVSYVITSYYARIAARSELRDLAEASGERIFLLSTQMEELAEEIEEHAARVDAPALYLSLLPAQLNRLASQAEVSVHDLQRIAGEDININQLRQDVRSTVERAIQTEAVKCPHCGADQQVALSLDPGKTKHTACAACRMHFILHRLPGGNIKLSYPDAFRVKCPNPDCGNDILVKKGPDEWGIVIRNCFECYARIKIDVDRKVVDAHELAKPLTVVRSAIVDGKAQCPGCGFVVQFKGTKNRRGVEVQYCPRCTKLITVKDDA